jgi:hypothetical protein
MASINRVDSQDNRINNLDETSTKDQLTKSINARLAKLKEQKEDLDDIAHSYGIFRPTAHIYEQIERIRKVRQVAQEALEKKESTKTLMQIDRDLHGMSHLNKALLQKLKETEKAPPTRKEQLAKQLLDPLTSAETKKAICETIANDPGSYEPTLLFVVGLEFLRAKNFDKAACLCLGAALRGAIDTRLCRDKSANLPFMYRLMLDETIKEIQLSSDEQQRWKAAWDQAVKNVEAWEKATPRNYNPYWLGDLISDLTEEKKRAAAQHVYKELNRLL